MKIVYTKHASEKFTHPDIREFNLKKKDIKLALNSPDRFGTEPLRGVEFALKALDAQHSLRVIYRMEGSIIVVITFYPSKKGRYEE